MNQQSEGLAETLYLCKMNPNVSGEPKFVAVIGRIVETRARGTGDILVGYKFLPNNSAHKASRKIWDSANASIPRWTEKLGFLRLLVKSELDAVLSKTGETA